MVIIVHGYHKVLTIGTYTYTKHTVLTKLAQMMPGCECLKKLINTIFWLMFGVKDLSAIFFFDSMQFYKASKNYVLNIMSK